MDITPIVMAVQTAAENSPSLWEKASAIGTVGATVVALGLGLSQLAKDRRRQRDVRTAISKSLRTDFDVWRAIVDDHRDSFDQRTLDTEAKYVAWVNDLKSPMMPALERFYMILPDLGLPISNIVVHAYAEAMRVGELISWEIGKRGVMGRDYVRIAGDIRGHLDLLSTNLEYASQTLKPYS